MMKDGRERARDMKEDTRMKLNVCIGKKETKPEQGDIRGREEKRKGKRLINKLKYNPACKQTLHNLGCPWLAVGVCRTLAEVTSSP